MPPTYLSPLQLKLLRTPLHDQFLTAYDIPWPTKDSDIATVRSVGPGAGNMTYILVANAGHFVSLSRNNPIKMPLS